MFQENFDDSASCLEPHNVKRKPVGAPPSLPQLSFENESKDNLATAFDVNRPKGPRPEPPKLNEEYTLNPLPAAPAAAAAPPPPASAASSSASASASAAPLKKNPPKRKPVPGSIDFADPSPPPPPPPPKDTDLPKDMGPVRTPGDEFTKFEIPDTEDKTVRKRLSTNLRKSWANQTHRREVSDPKSIRSVSTVTDDDTTEEDYEDDDRFERESISRAMLGHGSNKYGFEYSPSRYWKYHVLKFANDWYMSTNPDTLHLSRPVGPSYYITVETGENSLKLVFTHENKPILTISSQNTREVFDICVDSQEHLKESKLSTWVGQAVLMQETMQLPNHKRVPCLQYSMKDRFGNEWVVGNRPEMEVQNEDNRMTTRLKVSSKIFFFLRSEQGPEHDVIMAVYRRRHPKRKRVIKESMNKLKDEEQYSQVDDDDACNEKAGWLYILDNISPHAVKEPCLWPIVVGLSTAMALRQRMDEQEKSFPRFLESVKQKFRRSMQL